MLPPIRYPLPTMLALLLLCLATWQGANWTRSWRAEMAARLHRAVEGPPVPSSTSPKVVAGPMTRRALLLRDGIVARSRPNGPATETIDRRMFVDIYDTWPLLGPITHVRVGNRNPIGWVEDSDLFAWDTRLVLRPPTGRLSIADSSEGPGQAVEVGRVPVPVVGWSGRAIEVATWDRPWEKVGRVGWVNLDELSPGTLGVLIGQVELPILVRKALDGDPSIVRLRAIIGRLTDNRAWSQGEVVALKKGLPPFVLGVNPDQARVAERLAEANARSEADASWSGISFRFLPLSDLP